jgi:hypothetical protein
MAIAGYLSEHSLAEIFKLIQKEYKTGLLSIIPEHDSVQTLEPSCYIWFQSGRIMAFSRDLNNLELIEIINKRQWIDAKNLASLVDQAKFIRVPLGIHLQSLGILTTEQLRLLFHSQVLQPVCLLFKLAEAKFFLNETAPLGYLEMTGMSIAAIEASLLGLRVLRDYRLLERKLPSADNSLQKVHSELPNFKLDTQETLVWKLANGDVSISQIAAETDLSLMTVRQIGFRLAMVGLVKELPVRVPLVSSAVQPSDNLMAKNKSNESNSFNLFTTDITGFLKKRG